MRVIADPDPQTFAGHALDWLLADPVGNNVAYTVVHHRASGRIPVEPGARWIRVEEGGRLVGAAIHTPPHGVLLSEMPLAGLDALVDHLVESGTAVPGVNGPDALADRFAGRLARLTGTRATKARASRMFRLDRVSPPARVAGRLREAVPADRDLLVEWSAAFGAEATPDHPQDAARPIDLRLGQPGLLWVWEVAGTPVSTAYLGEPAVGVVRVSGVYTPPALRGRGYASACVAGLSQHALDDGVVACMLYTDLANPTSNKIYQAIGYRPVMDTHEWRFS